MMKLGTQTGSLINHLQSRAAPVTPEIGMGATILSWSDRAPATVVSWDGKLMGIQEDHAKRTDDNGMSDCQTYAYTPNPEAYIQYFRATKAGGWDKVQKNPETGRWNKVGTGGIRVGSREKYHDFSF